MLSILCRGSHYQHQHVLQCDSDRARALGLPSAGGQGLQHAPHYLQGECTLLIAWHPKGLGTLRRGHVCTSVCLVCPPQALGKQSIPYSLSEGSDGTDLLVLVTSGVCPPEPVPQSLPTRV